MSPSINKCGRREIPLSHTLGKLPHAKIQTHERLKRTPFIMTKQNSGAVWKSRWPSWAPLPNNPTVSVDVKHHSTNQYDKTQNTALFWVLTKYIAPGYACRRLTCLALESPRRRTVVFQRQRSTKDDVTYDREHFKGRHFPLSQKPRGDLSPHVSRAALFLHGGAFMDRYPLKQNKRQNNMWNLSFKINLK